MTESLSSRDSFARKTDARARPADQTFVDDAQTLVTRTEQSVHQRVRQSVFADQLVSGLRATSWANLVVLRRVEDDSTEELARSGMSLVDGLEVNASWSDAAIDVSLDGYAPQSRWTNDEASTKSVLVTSKRIHDARLLVLELQFEGLVEQATRELLLDLVEALMDLAATVYVRDEVELLRRQLQDRQSDERWTARLYKGSTLQESFLALSAAIAEATKVDRVSLLSFKSGKPRLVATSTQSKIDRRCRQVHQLEKLVRQAQDIDRPLHFSLASHSEPRPEWEPALSHYVDESGCRELWSEIVHEEQKKLPIAAIVLENFRGSASRTVELPSRLDPIREIVSDAIRQAGKREEAAAGILVRRVAQNWSQKKVLTAGILFIAAAAVCWVPVTLQIPAQGRLVPAQQRHLFAPADGSVSEIHVEAGQNVNARDRLLTLRSAQLELNEQKFRSELANAQTRLDASLATRGRSEIPNSSADEQVLRSQIEGLRAQLQLVEVQLSQLEIRSPISGRIEGFDLQTELDGRPVRHGQFLFTVASARQGWVVELEIPDDQIGYLTQTKNADLPCSFRLRSDPSQQYHEEVGKIASSAHLSPSGRSVVNAIVPFHPEHSDDLRSGATVIAEIACGKRSAGFVYLRSVVEWWRQQGWF